MRLSPLIPAAALALGLISSAPASAATFPLSPATWKIVGAAALGITGAVIYTNERNHHKADNAKNAEIQEALLEKRARDAGYADGMRAAGGAPNASAGTIVAPPSLAPHYVCTNVDDHGVCQNLVPG